VRIPVARRRLGMRIRTSKSGEPTGALDSNKHLHRLTEQGGTLLDPRQSSSLVNKLVIQCDRRAHSIPLHQTAHHDVVHDAEHQANGRGSSDRSRRGTGPISTRNRTDLDAEPDRSRRKGRRVRRAGRQAGGQAVRSLRLPAAPATRSSTTASTRHTAGPTHGPPDPSRSRTPPLAPASGTGR